MKQNDKIMLIDKLAWIEIKNKKILSTLSKGKQKYYIPGGKRASNETDHQALIREIREELDIDLIEDSLQYFGTFQSQADGHAKGIEVKMTCYTGQYQGVLKASSEIEKIVWLTYEDIEDVSPVDQIIFNFLRKKELL